MDGNPTIATMWESELLWQSEILQGKSREFFLRSHKLTWTSG